MEFLIFFFDMRIRKRPNSGTREYLDFGRFNQALSACPVLQALTLDANLVEIARRYLGAEPVLVGARMWWSFAGPADAVQQLQAGQGFHYDIDGYRALAFSFT
jgi:hypothetical protein